MRFLKYGTAATETSWEEISAGLGYQIWKIIVDGTAYVLCDDNNLSTPYYDPNTDQRYWRFGNTSIFLAFVRDDGTPNKCHYIYIRQFPGGDVFDKSVIFDNINPRSGRTGLHWDPHIVPGITYKGEPVYAEGWDVRLFREVVTVESEGYEVDK